MKRKRKTLVTCPEGGRQLGASLFATQAAARWAIWGAIDQDRASDMFPAERSEYFGDYQIWPIDY